MFIPIVFVLHVVHVLIPLVPGIFPWRIRLTGSKRAEFTFAVARVHATMHGPLSLSRGLTIR